MTYYLISGVCEATRCRLGSLEVDSKVGFGVKDVYLGAPVKRRGSRMGGGSGQLWWG